MSDTLFRGAEKLALTLSVDQVSSLNAYLALLQKWNRAYNLTAIRDPEKMVIYHLLDSLAVAPNLPDADQEVIDVGTGAGLPGIPLSILQPKNRFVLLDSNGKKTRFLTQAKIELGLSNCTIVNQRVEEYKPDNRFDVVVSRAFTSLEGFAESTTHLLKEDGCYFAMKGKFPDKELAELNERFKIDNSIELHVPFLDEERHLVVLKRGS